MRTRHVALLVAVTLVGAGRSAGAEIPKDARAALEKAAEWELYSLDPEHQKDPPRDGFHGWKVLGKTTVKDAETRKSLLTALDKGAQDNDGTVARCFDPRHGIRVKDGDKTIDLVICFECYQVKTFT